MCIKPVGTIDHSTYKYVVWYVVIPNFMILVGITMDKHKTGKGGSLPGLWPGFDPPVLRSRYTNSTKYGKR